MEAIKVLYVEDEVSLAKIVRESLESRGFEVLLVSDGEQVLSAFEQFRPDVCVLDVMLPRRDGFSLGADLRKRQSNLPILFLTARTQSQDVIKGFQSGGNDYIRKPFSLEELILRIQNLVQIMQSASSTNSEKAPSDAVALGRYLFYPNRFELHLEDKVRKLSHRETQLLQILAQHANTAVHRKEILMAVWGDDSIFNSRNLDVYITRLRDYLREDEQLQIVTLKGIGYHFVVGEGR